MTSIDEELYQRQLEEEQRRESEARRRQAIKKLAKKQAVKVIKKAAKKRAVAWALRSGLASALGAIAAALSPVLIVALIIVLGIGVVILTITAVCNSDTLTGRLGAAIGSATGPVGAAAGLLGWTFCKDFQGIAGVQSIVSYIDQGGAQFCNRPQFLASQHNTAYPRQNDPDLDRLIDCIVSGIRGNPGEIYSFDLTYTTCNYTRGQPLCEKTCSHSRNSCHYGGTYGSTGSLAVDFDNEDNGAQILQEAIACSQQLNIPLKRATCEDGAANAIECAHPSATHVHISLGKCDKDSGPIHTR